MYLSMWILADWLKKYHPVVKISSGGQVLKNVRYITDAQAMTCDHVYIGHARDFVSSIAENIICVSGQDMLLMETEDMEEIFNDILAAFDFYHEWDDSMQAMIRERRSLQDMADRSRPVFGRPMFVCDSSHMVLACQTDCAYPEIYEPAFSHIRESHFLPLESIAVINQEIYDLQQMRRPYLHCSEAMPYPSLLRNLFYGQTHIGWVVMESCGASFSQGTYQLFDFWGRCIEEWYEFDESKEELASQADIFLELLTGNVLSSEELNFRLQAINWKNSDTKLLMKIVSEKPDYWMHVSLQKIFRQVFSSCYALLYEGAVVLIANLNLCPETQLLEALSGLLKQSKTCCGVSYPFTDVSRLRQSYHQADIALAYGKKRRGGIYYCRDCALAYIQDVLRKNLSVDIRHELLEQLRGYDESHQTEYYETLFYYLLWERNQVETARHMFIHRNTLVYRINRIQELFLVDLDNPAVRLHLLLSYFISKNIPDDFHR